MRLTYILTVAVVATLHSSATAFFPAKDSKAAIENESVPTVGGRMLRREYGNDALDADDYIEEKKSGYGDDALDDDDLDDDSEEERGFGEVLKKLNPVTAVQKSAKKTKEHAKKVSQALKDAADYEAMIAKAKESVYKN